MTLQEQVARALRGEVEVRALVEMTHAVTGVMGSDEVPYGTLPQKPTDHYPDQAFAWIGPEGSRDYLHHNEDVRREADGAYDHHTINPQLLRAGLERVDNDSRMTPAERESVKAHLLYHMLAIDVSGAYTPDPNADVDHGSVDPENAPSAAMADDQKITSQTARAPVISVAHRIAAAMAAQGMHPQNDPVTPIAAEAMTLGAIGLVRVAEAIELAADESVGDLMRKLSVTTREKFGDQAHTEEVYDDELIVSVWDDNPISGGRYRYYQVGWAREGTSVKLMGEPQEVDRRTTYVPIGEVKTPRRALETTQAGDMAVGVNKGTYSGTGKKPKRRTRKFGPGMIGPVGSVSGSGAPAA